MTFDEEREPMIASYHRRVTETGALVLTMEDNDNPYHIGVRTIRTHTPILPTTSKVKITSLLYNLGTV